MNTKKIGAFIALKRKAKGYTQEQLGECLGVSNKTVSRWENGNYMPDLSLLEPLSRELGVSLNELLAGEMIEAEKAIEYSELNLISTIDYSNEKIRNEHQKISLAMIVVGVSLILSAFGLSPAESSWSSLYSILGLGLLVSGIFKEVKGPVVKRFIMAIALFIVMFMGMLGLDALRVSMYQQVPIYRYQTVTKLAETKIVEYKTPFYYVFRINADTANEYFILDNKKEYTIDTVPISIFNRAKSGIEHLIKFQSRYIGDNSNTGNLIGSLPLSEYGYVFQIDSEAYGLTIDYHFTDWYMNENGYVERGLVYNAASISALIENVNTICFNFSGSSYTVTRHDFIENYPKWQYIVTDEGVDQDSFNQYVEMKMNDLNFIQMMFKYFK